MSSPICCKVDRRSLTARRWCAADSLRSHIGTWRRTQGGSDGPGTPAQMEIIILHQLDKIFGVGAGGVLDGQLGRGNEPVRPPGKIKDAPEKVMTGCLPDQQLFFQRKPVPGSSQSLKPRGTVIGEEDAKRSLLRQV